MQGKLLLGNGKLLKVDFEFTASQHVILTFHQQKSAEILYKYLHSEGIDLDSNPPDRPLTLHDDENIYLLYNIGNFYPGELTFKFLFQKHDPDSEKKPDHWAI